MRYNTRTEMLQGNWGTGCRRKARGQKSHHFLSTRCSFRQRRGPWLRLGFSHRPGSCLCQRALFMSAAAQGKKKKEESASRGERPYRELSVRDRSRALASLGVLALALFLEQTENTRSRFEVSKSTRGQEIKRGDEPVGLSHLEPGRGRGLPTPPRRVCSVALP